MSHGERVTPHWLLGGRSRRAVSLDDEVRTRMASVLPTAGLGCVMPGLGCRARVEVPNLWHP